MLLGFEKLIDIENIYVIVNYLFRLYFSIPKHLKILTERLVASSQFYILNTNVSEN